MFEKVLVANRGEIAVRVMRACEELGVDTVAIYSDSDRDGGHVRYADEAYNVGAPPAAESYLDQDAILEAAEKADVDAIHPGYGFLAENESFARAVEESPFVWVGPSSAAMKQLGEKTNARTVMDNAGVPVVPGTLDPIDDVDDVIEFGEQHGYPIAIKAEGGGGGRGLRVVNDPDEAKEQLASAKREGEAYFDNASVYLERYLPSPKHIEVQILADQDGNVRHLGERDCSLQRRHQKVIEEAPSPSLDDDLRHEIGEAARDGIAAADYTNAGTVEFLVEDDEFYFLEVNTRIQVEHTVTEMITGIDVVKWQLRIAAGESLTFDQEDVTFDGHAIEYRINAENPAEQFTPTPGTLETYDPPGGIGVRLDDAIRQGDVIAGNYDSMIAKLVVAGETRQESLARSTRALSEFDIEGIHTTIPFHLLMLEDDHFVAGTHTTDYLDSAIDADALAEAVDRWGPTTARGDRVPAPDLREFTIEVNGKRFDVALEDPGTAETTSSASSPQTSSSQRREQESTSDESVSGEEVIADMQGTILDVTVAEGDSVEPGDVVCVLEAMKMENDITTERGGTITEVAIEAGDSVNMGDTLVVIE